MSLENTLSIGLTTSIGGTTTLICIDDEKDKAAKKKAIRKSLTIAGVSATSTTAWDVAGGISAADKIDAINQYRESAAYIQSVDSKDLIAALAYITSQSSPEEKEVLAEKIVEGMEKAPAQVENPVVKRL